MRLFQISCFIADFLLLVIAICVIIHAYYAMFADIQLYKQRREQKLNSLVHNQKPKIRLRGYKHLKQELSDKRSDYVNQVVLYFLQQEIANLANDLNNKTILKNIDFLLKIIKAEDRIQLITENFRLKNAAEAIIYSMITKPK